MLCRGGPLNTILNFAIFHIGWLACVMGASADRALEGSVIAVVLIAVHILRSENVRNEMLILVAAVLIGFTWETVLLLHGSLSYRGVIAGAEFAPYWLVLMWALFATTINESMAWMKQRWLLAAVMGAIFGPMAFLAGERLGAVEFINLPAAIAVLAVGWALLLPLMLWLADQINASADVTPESVYE